MRFNGEARPWAGGPESRTLPPSQTPRGPRMFARTLPASALLAALAALVNGPAAADGPKDNIPDNVRPIPPKGVDVPEADLKELKAGLAELRAAIDWLP